MNKPTVLVIEDDRRYQELIELNLAEGGYHVLIAGDGLAGLNLLEQGPVDLVILDVALPRMDGYEVCKRIRDYSAVPIIMLTARAEEANKIRGLRLGADDYVTKPFSPAELMARMEAVLRRAGRDGQSGGLPRFVNGDLAIDFVERRVTVAGEEVGLSGLEYRLLQNLAQNAGRVLVPEELLRRVWGPGYEGQVELVHTTVWRLRNKLGDSASSPRFLATRRGVGYVLVAPPQSPAS